MWLVSWLSDITKACKVWGATNGWRDKEKPSMHNVDSWQQAQVVIAISDCELLAGINVLPFCIEEPPLAFVSSFLLSMLPGADGATSTCAYDSREKAAWPEEHCEDALWGLRQSQDKKPLETKEDD